ncbi:MAG TPA: DUF5916 domain-containing protein [Gemmatimonadaceae bacterium]|nr:DUF5916 domain-containing protein [Gemmatimonadaceae bacterium]
MSGVEREKLPGELGAAQPLVDTTEMRGRTRVPRALVASLLIATSLSPSLRAQTSSASAHARRPTATATQLAGRVTLDGRLDEPDWAQAIPIGTLVQLDPDEGQPVSERTDVRILYDGEALYVGARLHDALPPTRRLVRRDAFVLDSDWLTVAIDSYHDHLSAFRFSVNPSGVRRDEVFSSSGRTVSSTSAVVTDRGGQADQSWDPVWSAATTVSDSGWIAEFRIPFSQLRFSGADMQTWGLQIERRIARKQELAQFAFTPKDQPSGVPYYGHLHGVSRVRASRRLEVLPYSSGRLFMRPLLARAPGVAFDDPFRSRAELSARAGADVKFRVTSNFTLDATLNPDFGQVELDPAVVNLTAFETQFAEKRPFFVEGAEILRFGTSIFGAPEGGPAQLIYSRRVGRAPQLTAPDSAVYADLPDVAAILGAAKLTGRTSNGWSIGVLEAVTRREDATFVTPSGARGGAVVEPLTSYFAGRVKRDQRGGRTTVGALATAVNRRLTDGAPAATLRSSAYSGGVDFRSETSNHLWSVVGSFSPSWVGGSPAAIAATQRSSNHYFNRPDATHLRYDPDATSMAGYRAQVDAGKRAGSWTGNVALTASSPGYEINDLGFQTSTDRIVLDPNVTYEHNRPGRLLRRWSVRAGPDNVWNYGWELVRRQSYLTMQAQLANYWTANVQLNHASPSFNDRLTRGGPLTRTPSANGARFDVGSDPRKPYTVAAQVNRIIDRSGLSQVIYSVDLGFKPADNWELQIGPDLTQLRQPAQYVTTVTDPTATNTFGRRYVFAPLEQTTLGIDTRLNVTFSPRLTLELYAQPFVSTNDFGALGELRAPRTFDFDRYGADVGTAVRDPVSGETTVDPDGAGAAKPFRVSDRDFDLTSLRGNAVLRWEWRPGSTLYVVWQQDRAERLGGVEAELRGRDVGRLDLGGSAGDLFGVRPINVLLFKVSYWLNP